MSTHRMMIDLRSFPLYFAYKRTSSRKAHFQETFHAHQGIEILLVHEGSGTLILDQKSYSIQSGTICLFQPYQLHHVRMEVSEHMPFVRSIIHYEPSLYTSYFDQWPAMRAFYKKMYQGMLDSPVRHDPEGLEQLDVSLRVLHDKIAELSKDQYYEEVSLFLLSFYHAFKPIWEKHRKSSDRSDRETRVPHQVERILEWLNDHYQEPLQMEQMSRDLYLSKHHLSHLFKASTGSSITDYLAARRMQQAARLLTHGDGPIAQVAEAVGLTNSSYFCKLFKSHYGLTPHQYRKQFR